MATSKAKEEAPVFRATLTVAQIQKQGVRLNVKAAKGEPLVLAESSLNFSRGLVPPDYNLTEGREYEMVITRVK